MIKKVVIIIAVVVLGCLVTDTVMYPGFSLRYSGIDAKLLLWLFSFVVLGASLIGVKLINKNSSFTVAFYCFLLLFIVSTTIKNLNYETFVLEKLHFYPEQVPYLSLFFGVLSVVSTGLRKVILGPLLLCLVVGIYLVDRGLFLSMVKEDGLIEFAQAVLYLIASLIFLLGVRKKQGWVVGLFLMFIFLEEISWGQRLIGFKTPESYVALNIQKETNIHNAKAVDPMVRFAYILVGVYGVWGWRAKRILAPSRQLGFFFGVVAMYFFMHTWSHNYYDIGTAVQTSVPRWQEICELFLAIGFLMFSVESVKLGYGKNKKSGS